MEHFEQAAENPENNDDQNNGLPVVKRVLATDLLLDMILEYAIIDNDIGMVKISDVKNYRLVHTTWLGSIDRILRKSESPLFFFRLCHERPELQHASAIVKFMKSQAGNLHPDVSPYAITALNEDCQPTSVFTCLTQYGRGLIRLNIRMSARQPLYPDSSNLRLPRLSKFTVHVYGDDTNRRANNDMQDKMIFIRSVFQASPQLKSFALHAGHHDNFVPNYFGNLPLPSSITDLKFNSKLNDHQLQILLKNCLPNLKTLKLLVSSPPYEDGLITSILQKLEKTLETLYVKYAILPYTVETTTKFQPPLMVNLKTLYINTPLFELEEVRSNLQELLPALTQVTLCLQTRKMLEKWTRNCCFPCVSFLKVSMVSEVDTWDNSVNIDLRTMQALHMAFPNVKELHITQFETEMTALVFIMGQMTSLRCLRILVDHWERLGSSDTWDAVLIGCPEGSVAALRESPDVWENLQGNNASIRNLTDLDTLELECVRPNGFSGITEIAFHYAFLEMPKLANLILKGGFRTTREMARRWEEREGRTIETSFDD